jgi:ectoine hydroxylase-related dioxygenase (phytanoyl-CoA dioxygenase family)
MLDLCSEVGWLDPEVDLMAGQWGGGQIYTEGDPQYMAVYKKVLHLSSFNDLPQNEQIINFMTRLIGAPAFNHRLRVGRMTFPKNAGQTTTAHQDFTYIRGTPETYTLWTPLGNCPVELGGLAILKGSHRLGLLEHGDNADKKYAGKEVTEEQWDDHPEVEWVCGDMQMGDALIFHSHTVHKAMPNLTENLLRLSVDNRYQRVGDPIEAASTKTHYQL